MGSEGDLCIWGRDSPFPLTPAQGAPETWAEWMGLYVWNIVWGWCWTARMTTGGLGGSRDNFAQCCRTTSPRFFSSMAWRFLARHLCCLKRAAALFLANRSAGDSFGASDFVPIVNLIIPVMSSNSMFWRNVELLCKTWWSQLLLIRSAPFLMRDKIRQDQSCDNNRLAGLVSALHQSKIT